MADGLHRNIITIRMSEKRKLQNASSTQSSIQSDWHFAILKFFVVHTINTIEASTAKMSVFVKCLYNENFTVFFLSLRVFIVCAKPDDSHDALNGGKDQVKQSQSNHPVHDCS